EPETYAMLLAGLGLVGWRMKKQHEASNKTAA
ncbi:PEP-CTERM sorting domain-containing protein, partial [Nitrosomonas sp.]